VSEIENTKRYGGNIGGIWGLGEEYRFWKGGGG